MDRIDDILFLYEDDTVEMADGGPITANKIPLKPANRNINNDVLYQFQLNVDGISCISSIHPL